MKQDTIKKRAAAIAAALKKKPAAAFGFVVLILILAAGVIYMGRDQVFFGIFKDESGLAMVREGDKGQVKKELDRKNVLRVYTDNASGVINPVYAVSDGDRMISSVIFEPLARRKNDGGLEPVLARKFQFTQDGSSCTISLKKKVKFSDGQEMTAEDVAFSIAAMCTIQDEGGPYGNIAGAGDFRQSRTELPAGIQIIDNYTLELSFEAPSPDNWMILLSRIQKSQSNGQGGVQAAVQQMSMGGVGTGPYEKAPVAEGRNIRLEENPFYRDKIHDIKAVEFVNYGTYEVEDAIKEQDIDAAFFSGSNSFFELFYEGKQYTIYEKPQDSLYYMAFNKNNRFLYVPEVRQAIAMAIDKDAYAKGELSRYVVKADGILPEGHRLTGEGALTYKKDQARKLMDEAKVTYGAFMEPVTLPVLEGNTFQQEMAKLLKEDLNALGMTVDIEMMDQARYMQQVYMLQDFDLILSSASGWEYAAAYSALATDFQGLPTACLSNELKDGVRKLEQTCDLKSRDEALKEISTICNRQVPVLPLARPKQFLAVSADLSGFKINQYDTFFTNIHEIRVR